jgi:hypothetical protein
MVRLKLGRNVFDEKLRLDCVGGFDHSGFGALGIGSDRRRPAVSREHNFASGAVAGYIVIVR